MWSEANHIPNILKLKVKYPHVKVGAVCDTLDPYVQELEHNNLKKLLHIDRSTWVKAQNNVEAPVDQLDALHHQDAFDVVVIACNPTAHYEYAMWAITRGVHVICDKPLIATKYASWNVEAAKDIFKKYTELRTAFKVALAKNPLLSFNLVLRRRSLEPFRLIADRLHEVQEGYGAGINHMNIISNSGVYKYPVEMASGSGAHDFTSGVGALSHSSYHYIDLMNWYLAAAPGDVAYIIPKLIKVTRVQDYLDANLYKSLMSINNHAPEKEEHPLTRSVRAAELDFAFNIGFYNSQGRLIGDANFISNHLSFSPRTRRSEKSVSNPAQYEDGGRTSHLYIDIHQSGLQNLQLLKNDRAFGQSNIRVELRSHPNLAYKERESLYYGNAYNRVEYSLGDLFEEIVVSIGENRPVKNDMIPSILDDELNNRLFSKFYELIAKNYSTKQAQTSDDDIISLNQYF